MNKPVVLDYKHVVWYTIGLGLFSLLLFGVALAFAFQIGTGNWPNHLALASLVGVGIAVAVNFLLSIYGVAIRFNTGLFSPAMLWSWAISIACLSIAVSWL